MAKDVFKVRAEAGATEHTIAVEIPTFAEATERQRQNAWEYAIRAVRIKVQGRLRERIKKGVRGEALSREAQAFFDAALNGETARASATVIDFATLFAGFNLEDAEVRKLVRRQMNTLTAGRATIVNIPPEMLK